MLLVTSPSFTGFTLPLLGIKARYVVSSGDFDGHESRTRFFCEIYQSDLHRECSSFLEVAYTLMELVTGSKDEI